MRCILKKLKSESYNKYIMEDNCLSIKKFKSSSEAFKYLDKNGESRENYECVAFNTIVSI